MQSEDRWLETTKPGGASPSEQSEPSLNRRQRRALAARQRKEDRKLKKQFEREARERFRRVASRADMP